MGTKLSPLIKPREIDYSELKGRIFAVDTHNMLYQFLTTIRSYDGNYLKTSKGIITSHLIGLFNRTTILMEKGLKLCFVFDGEIPDLKKEEVLRRRESKEVAQEKYERAMAERNIEEAKKQAQRTARLTNEMISDAKKIISALGLPIVEALSEGEAQSSQMVKEGIAWATISQDYDTLLFGCSRVVRNLTISQKRKISGTQITKEIKPEIIELKQVLNDSGLSQDKLIALGIMSGTDYEREGIKGIGPMKALKILKENSIEKAFAIAGWHSKILWMDIFKLIKEMPTRKNIELKWEKPNLKKLKTLLIEEYEFNPERVEKTLEKFDVKQTDLGSFF